MASATERSDASVDPIGVLLVHGIGRQQPGETLRGFIEGLRKAYPGLREHPRAEDASDRVVIDGIGRTLHVFEVYWADLLGDDLVKGTFDFDQAFETVWFPLLNQGSGLLPTTVVPRAKVLAGTWILAPLVTLLSAGYVGAQIFAALATGALRELRRDEKSPREEVRQHWRRLTAGSGGDPDHGRTLLDDLMDQIVGDIFNYMRGMARAFPEETEQSRQLVASVRSIHERFRSCANQAVAAGCSELQVVAHSLGSVIAFHALMPDRAIQDEAVAALTRFYTIGSPLEKARLFWTRLVATRSREPALQIDAGSISGARCEWHNFYSPLDLVSDPLGPFEGWPAPSNHAAAGLGGLARAHVAYHQNPTFLRRFCDGLRGVMRPQALQRPNLLTKVGAVAESLALPLGLLTLAVIGLLFFAGIGWGTGWLVSQPLEWLGLDGWAQGVRIYVMAAPLLVMFLGKVFIARRGARASHARFWVADKVSGAGREGP